MYLSNASELRKLAKASDAYSHLAKLRVGRCRGEDGDALFILSLVCISDIRRAGQCLIRATLIRIGPGGLVRGFVEPGAAFPRLPRPLSRNIA